MTMLSENDIALAGEYVLGLLDAAENAAVQGRIATDAAFAAEVEAWRERLQSMVAGVDAAAPDQVWQAVKAGLPQDSGQDIGRGRLRIWQGMTALSAALAAFFGFLVWQQPETLPVQQPLIAALGSETGATSITARYDSASGELLMTPVELDTGQLYPEIWIVPSDGQARSLGMMAVGKPTQVTVTPELRRYMAQGALLAITPEPFGGAPGGKATGPIIASGTITTI